MPLKEHWGAPSVVIWQLKQRLLSPAAWRAFTIPHGSQTEVFDVPRQVDHGFSLCSLWGFLSGEVSVSDKNKLVSQRAHIAPTLLASSY